MKKDYNKIPIEFYHTLADGVVKMAIHDFTSALWNLDNGYGDDKDKDALENAIYFFTRSRLCEILYSKEQRDLIIEMMENKVKEGLVYSYGKEDWIKPSGKARYF